ncbi:hypothetical protein [Azospirillum brasilense]|uniref:hypothetical protein n=1 Tax=Azospirillum brasilense TaxID=192 RepID=UPI0010C0D1B1|nr:hypothetical protein [Azospirillum brasilense]
MKILFPENKGQRYYDIHFRYILEIFRYSGADIDFANISSENETVLFCNVDGQWILFDFSDAGLWTYDSKLPVFKFHCKTGESYLNVFPFSPVSFYDWDEFYRLRSGVKYAPVGRLGITMRQRPYGNALQRRLEVMTQLRVAFGDAFANDQLPQAAFWDDVSNIRLSVCVPGQNNNMLDRGQLQYMALGAATVSPRLPEVLPFDANLDGCYLPCADGYEDLTSVIANADDATLEAIGRKAADVFERSCTPARLVEWVERCIHAHERFD